MAGNGRRGVCCAAQAPGGCFAAWGHCSHTCSFPHLHDRRHPLRLQTGKATSALACIEGNHSELAYPPDSAQGLMFAPRLPRLHML